MGRWAHALRAGSRTSQIRRHDRTGSGRRLGFGGGTANWYGVFLGGDGVFWNWLMVAAAPPVAVPRAPAWRTPAGGFTAWGSHLGFSGGCQGVKLSHQQMILEFGPGDPAACPPPPVRGGGTLSRARLPPGASRGAEVRPGPSPPHFSLPRLLREQWIRAKYERQEFTHPERQEPYSAGEAAAPVRPSVRPSGSLPPRPLEPTWGVCVRPSAPDAEPAALAPGAPRLSPSPDP